MARPCKGVEDKTRSCSHEPLGLVKAQAFRLQELSAGTLSAVLPKGVLAVVGKLHSHHTNEAIATALIDVKATPAANVNEAQPARARAASDRNSAGNMTTMPTLRKSQAPM